MDGELEAVIGRGIYNKIRTKCRGYIECTIKYDTLYLSIEFCGFTYKETIRDIADKILLGQFNSDDIVESFITGYEKTYLNYIRKKMFYTDEIVP